MSSSTSKAGDGGPDRPTSPGTGDELRDTLRGPVAPAVVPKDPKRTIPMGTGVSAEWIRNQASARSGVHSVEAPQAAPADTQYTARTKSDRVPVARTKHPTLTAFPAAKPPSDEKRWIGAAVPPGANPPVNLGATLRTYSTPPPAGAPPPTTRSPYPPPITPARTIKISPEIAIPPGGAAQTSVDGPQSSTPSPPPPASTPVGPPIDAATQETVIPPSARQAAAADTTNARPVSTQPEPAVSKSASAVTSSSTPPTGGVTTRTLVVGGVLSCVAIGAILLLTRPQAPVATKPAIAVSPTPPESRAPQSAPPAGPSTEIISIPPGAEIVLRGAMVANAPARLLRPSYESLYLLRLPGYQPQLVALSPHSPDQIRVTLQPAGQPAASAPTGAVAPAQ